jgi:hypothetical protein
VLDQIEGFLVRRERARTLVLLDLRVAADREDALALDRQRLGNREPVVHGDDLAVQQHDVRRRLRRRRFAPGEGDGSKDKGTYDGAHDDLLETAAACHSIMPQRGSMRGQNQPCQRGI